MTARTGLMTAKRQTRKLSPFLLSWRNALAQASSRPAQIVVLGDSIAEGYSTSNLETLGYAGRLRTHYQSLYGDGGMGLRCSPIASHAWTETGGWSNNGYGPYGVDRTGSGGDDTITLNNLYADSFLIGYLSNGGFPSFDVSIDGGPYQTVTTPIQSLACRSLTYAVPLGTHSITVRSPASGYCGIWGISAHAGNSGVRVHRMGKNGTNAGSGGGDNNRLQWLSLISPDLVIVAYGSNDFAAQVPLATYQANLERIVDKAKSVNASVVLMTWPYREGVSSPAIPQSGYTGTMRNVAAAKGCVFFDLQQRWGIAGQQPHETYVPDGVHPSEAGHADIAEALKALLSS